MDSSRKEDTGGEAACLSSGKQKAFCFQSVVKNSVGKKSSQKAKGEQVSSADMHPRVDHQILNLDPQTFPPKEQDTGKCNRKCDMKCNMKWGIIIVLQALIIIGLAIPLGLLASRSQQVHHPMPANTQHVTIEVNGSKIDSVQTETDSPSETQRLSSGEPTPETHITHAGHSTLSTTGQTTFQTVKIHKLQTGELERRYKAIVTVQTGLFSQEACLGAGGSPEILLKLINENPSKFREDAKAVILKYFEKSELNVKSVEVETVFEMVYNVAQKVFEVAKYDDQVPAGLAESNGNGAQPVKSVDCSPAAAYPLVLQSLKERIKKRLVSLKDHGKRRWTWFKDHIKRYQAQSELSKKVSKWCIRMNRLSFACSIAHLQELVGEGAKLGDNHVVKDIFKIQLKSA